MPDSGERARIRSIMYEPSKVWLATEHCGDRWLTDQFVLYDVTGAEVLQCYDESYGIEWPDGPYQLMATGQWRANRRDSIPEPDIEAFLRIMAGHIWYLAEPTEWSVAEHPGKAMLWNVGGMPALLGESTWSAIKRHHPDCVVEFALNLHAGTFRFSQAMCHGPAEACETHECDCRMVPFAFAAGIEIPEGQEEIALTLTEALEATSNKVAA